MPLGPGKYDAICTKAREEAEADTVLLIVLKGKYGEGFSIQTANPLLPIALPELLRATADDIERDLGRSKL